MRKKIFQKIEIPQEVEADIDANTVTISGPMGKITKKFSINKLNFEKKDKEIIIGSENATKKEKKMINTISSHIRNMIKGVKEKFEYKLKACFSHFPINVEIKGDEALIKNFLGEKVPRKIIIPEGVDIKVDRDIITVTSVNKELAGQTAANFETATRIRMKDRRVFQDGIFITNKAGREI
jgi:large subunit ribosomal protein L6